MTQSAPPVPSPWEIFLATPGYCKAELIDGLVFAHARPSLMHQEVASGLEQFLKSRFQYGEGGGPGGWIVLPEVELAILEYKRHLSPDLAGWHRERMPKVPRAARTAITPDWVCEILSPGDRTRKQALKLKLPAYADAGVGHIWLVDPAQSSLEAFALINRAWTLLGMWTPGDRAKIAPFDAVETDLALFWQDIEPDSETPG